MKVSGSGVRGEAERMNIEHRTSNIEFRIRGKIKKQTYDSEESLLDYVARKKLKG